MEINFQTHHHHKESISMKKVTKFKGRKGSNSSSGSNKFVGVRQRSSGKWIAEIKDTTHKKIRMWLGTFGTAEEAARAYDQAACLLRGSNTRTNFVTTRVSADSQLAYRIRNLVDSKKIAKQNKHGNSVFASTCCTSSTCTSTSTGSLCCSDSPKVLAHECQILQKFDTHPKTFLKSLSNITSSVTSNISSNSSNPSSIVDSVSSVKIQESHLLEGNLRGYEKILNSCYDEIIQENQLFDHLYKPTTTTVAMTQSQTSSGWLSESSRATFLHLSSSQADNNLYKPDMINCSDGFDMDSCSSQPEVSWGFEFAQELLDFPVLGESRGEMGYTKFERMKVERQISASLYAVNSVQEYMETVHDDPVDLSLWDLPPLCSLLS